MAYHGWFANMWGESSVAASVDSLSVGASPLQGPMPHKDDPHTRAMNLLWRWLTDEQRRDLKLNGYFTVVGYNTGAQYKIHAEQYYGVEDTTDGGQRYCFGPSSHLLGQPIMMGDQMLAQKLALEHDEAEALRVANKRSFIGFCAPTASSEVPFG